MYVFNQRVAVPCTNIIMTEIPVIFNAESVQLIKNILKPENFTFNVYDCHSLSHFESGKVFHKRLNVIEGVYSLHPELSDYFDYKIYLDVSDEKQEARILDRSGEKKLERYKKEWIPLESRYFDTYKIKEQCDVVMDTTNLF